MKVLVVIEPGENGAFTYAEALCEYLMAQGVDVHLAYSDRRGGDRLAALVRRVEANSGQTVNLGVDGRVTPADFRAFGRLWRLARRVRPDVVHGHSSKAGVLGRMLAATGIRACYFYHPHAYYGMRPRRGRLDGVYDAIESALGRIGSTITVSIDEWGYAAKRLQIPLSRLRLVPNGVDTDRFRDATPAERRAIRAELGVPADRIVLGAMSRLCAQKDPVTLYRAFAAALGGRPGLHLLHVGSGELEGEVDALVAELGIGDRVTRVRYMSDPTRFYKAVDGFILTSTYEGLSLASLEAVSANLPLVLSRAPGNNDLLELPLSHAWGADPGSVPQFAEGIGRWHDAAAAGLRLNHRAIARERFDSRKAFASVLAQYRGAILAAARSREAWSKRLPVLVWLGLIALESTDRFSNARTHRLLFPPVSFPHGSRV